VAPERAHHAEAGGLRTEHDRRGRGRGRGGRTLL